MKKILIFAVFILPLAMMSQTRPSPKKIQDRPTYSKDKPVIPTQYSYLIMQIVEKKVKKGQNPYTYSIDSFDAKYSEKISRLINDKITVIDALNYLGMRGWQLVTIDNGSYYFKSNSIGVKRKI